MSKAPTDTGAKAREALSESGLSRSGGIILPTETEVLRMTSAWMGGIDSPTLLQRIGFVLMSTLVLCAGFVLTYASSQELVKRDWYGIAGLLLGFPLLYVGLRGVVVGLRGRRATRR